jgi:hypothetical protein
MPNLELLDAVTDGTPTDDLLDNELPTKGEWKFLFYSLGVLLILAFAFMLSVTDYSILDILAMTVDTVSWCFTPIGAVCGILSIIVLYVRYKLPFWM